MGSSAIGGWSLKKSVGILDTYAVKTEKKAKDTILKLNKARNKVDN